MNWYKLASVNFSPKNYMTPDRNDNILSICFNLAHKLHEKYPMINVNNIAPDGDCFDKPTGIINIYMHDIPTEEQEQLINDAKEELKKLELEIDENVIKNTFRDNAVLKGIPEQDVASSLKGRNIDDIRVARIAILRNFNVEFREVKEMFRTDHAPELNMTESSAIKIVEDVLGFPNYQEFDVHEAKQRIEEKLNDPSLKLHIDPSYNTYNGHEIESIRRKLSALLNLVNWCINHSFDTIQVA